MTRRAAAGLALLVALPLAGGALLALAANAFLATEHWTGWALALAFLLLGLRGLPRRQRGGSASGFLWLHLQAGWIAGLLFLVHAGGFPAGMFDRLLWITFLTALVSGAVGFAVQRWFTRRQRNWPALPVQRIEPEREGLAAEAEACARRLVGQGAPAVFARVYASHLLPWLRAPRNLLPHLAGSTRPLDDLLLQLDYAGSGLEAKADFRRLRAILIRKSHLDERRALAWLQQGWLFVHVPAAAAAAVLVLLHILLVHAYGG